MLRNLVASLDRQRFDTLVVSLTTRSPIGDELSALGIPVEVLGGSGGVLSLRQIVRLAKIAAAWRPDVIHAWMYHSNLAAFALSLSPTLRRPALITSVRGALNAPDQQKLPLRVVRRLDALLSRRADAIVFNSAISAGQHVALGYDGRRVNIIPNGFDTTLYLPSPDARERIRKSWVFDQEPIVGIIGRFDPLKGHRRFLEAAALVTRDRPDCRFVLAGRGCDDSNSVLTGWIAELGLRDRALLLGEQRDVASLDCALDAIVCASLSESFPNSIGEAMCCGVPAIVTDVGDCAALVGDTGIVVPPRDAPAIADGILRVIRLDASARTNLGARARARMVEKYALPLIATRYAALYESVNAARLGRLRK